MTTTIAINCGCGRRFTGETEGSTSLARSGLNGTDVQSAMVAALAHCRETGHTLEILGQVQP